MNSNNGKNSKTAGFLKGKGFYAALGLSIAMVGAASFFAYTRTADKLNNQLDSVVGNSESKQKETTQKYQNAGANQTDIPKDETKKSETVQTTTESVETEAEVQANAPVAEPAEPAANNKADSSPVAMPIEGEVINEFSGTELVKSSTTGAWQTHNGIDIAGNLGDEVKAMTNGVVTDVKEDSLWGVTVTIDHGSGITARYCNLNKGVNVQAGSEVAAGAVIGAIGDTCEIESAEPSHLHFEVLQNGQYIDPLEFIGMGDEY